MRKWHDLHDFLSGRDEQRGILVPYVKTVGKYVQPDPFVLLDRFINSGAEEVRAFHQALVAVTTDSGAGDYGPFSDDADMRAHWGTEWTNESGRGGSFWPGSNFARSQSAKSPRR